jgi:hypothetical protein
MVNIDLVIQFYIPEDRQELTFYPMKHYLVLISKVWLVQIYSIPPWKMMHLPLGDIASIK